MQLAERRAGRPHSHSIRPSRSQTHLQNLESTPTLANTVRVTCVYVLVWPCTILTHRKHTNFTVTVSESVHECVDFRGTYRPFGVFIRLIWQAKLIMLHLHCSLITAPPLIHCSPAGIALLTSLIISQTSLFPTSLPFSHLCFNLHVLVPISYYLPPLSKCSFSSDNPLLSVMSSLPSPPPTFVPLKDEDLRCNSCLVLFPEDDSLNSS